MERVEDTCPKCGSHLILREGEHNEFLACPRFPDCRYTQSLYGKEPKLLGVSHAFCKVCNHTGLLPFVKNDKVIPNAWINCECNQPKEEHYQSVKVEDFDFPMSSTFRGYSYQYCGIADPLIEERQPPEPKEELAIKNTIHYHRYIPVEKKRIKKYT